MSLPQKGLRKITIDGNIYEWTIRHRSTSGILYHKKKLIAAIQIKTDSDRGKLIVDFGVSPPNSWRNPHKTAVEPKTIEAAITTAIKKGWDPMKKGTFELNFPIQFIPDPNAGTEHSKYD